MKIKGIEIKLSYTNNGKRIQLTKRLPNGRTYTRYVNEDEQKELTVALESFVKDADKKYKEVKVKM